MSTYKSYIVQEDRSIKLQEFPLPALAAGEVLVKVSPTAAAQTTARFPAAC